MKSVGAYEAKTHLSRLLGKVARGERFTITRNGVPVALLIPAAEARELKVGEVIAAIKRSRQGRTLGGLSVQDMIEKIRAEFEISDEEALYIKQVTEKKVADPIIRTTVHAHRDDRLYLEGAYRGQVNGEIQETYEEIGRYEELTDPKYTETGAIFDIMAMTVIETNLASAA